MPFFTFSGLAAMECTIRLVGYLRGPGGGGGGGLHQDFLETDFLVVSDREE